MANIWDLKKQQRTYYKSIVSVFCPILNETVYFTAEGFNHLLYETYWKPRSIGEQYMKLMCLPFVPDVIKNCPQISTRKVTRVVKGKKKQGIHYQLVHEIKPKVKIRVVIERLGTGKYRFLSVMPHDKKSKINMSKGTKKHP